MTALVEITTTVSAEDDARTLARRLVESGEAACVSFQRVESVYQWQGELVQEAEFQLTLKTTAAAAERAEAALRAAHPYDVPAILTVPVLRAGEDYAAWVAAAVERG